MHVELFAGDRREIDWLFSLADDSASAVAAYRDKGDVWVAIDDGRIVGHIQAVAATEPSTMEIKNMAVAPDRQGDGIGRAAMEHALAELTSRGVRRVIVATASASTGNLRFYQRLGFRMRRVVRDAFTPDTGYPEEVLLEGGIPLRDQVWLDIDL